MNCNYRSYVWKTILWFFAMFIGLGAVHAQNRINADLGVPNLEVENGAKTFRVRINKTENACTDGTLKIKLPTGFNYEAKSAKIDGVSPLTEAINTDGVTIPLGTIASGSSGYIEVTFNVEALCPALAVDLEKRLVNYTLNGCDGAVETKDGNTINLQYAVLNISVTPEIELAVVGKVLTRKITIKNTGTGAISEFKIPVNYEAGILREATQETLPTGLTFDEATKTYLFKGDFVSGGTLTFTEKLIVNSCEGLTTEYNAIYGTSCVRHANDKAYASVQIDDTMRPRVVITDISNVQTVCMGGIYNHTWKIKNEGNAPASLVNLAINAGEIQGTIAITDVTGATVGGYTVAIDVLLPGEERTVTFTQKYKEAPDGTNCEMAPFKYATEPTGYEVSYEHSEGCINGQTPKYATSGTTKETLVFAFDGDNVGEEDIIEGNPYQADFKIGTWSFPEEGLSDNARLEIIIDLSANLSTSDLSALKLFNGASEAGVSVDKISATKYVVRLDRNALISGTEGNWRLKFPLILTCPTSETPFYKITSTLHNCDNTITFKCETVNLTATCPERGCFNGGMGLGTISLKRVTLGLEDKDNDGIPDNANMASGLGESIRSFVAGDIIEITQEGIVADPESVKDYIWKNGGRFEVTVDAADLGMVATGLKGKVVVTRAGTTTFTFADIAVQTENGKFYITLPSLGAVAGFNGFQDGDQVEASLQLKASKANVVTGLKKFITSYGLYDESEPPVLRSCGNLNKVSGYYAATELKVSKVNEVYNLPGCVSGQVGAGVKIDFTIDDDNYRNALFPDEFREITKPKSVAFTVSAGLTMNGYRLELLGNGAIPTYIDVTNLSVAGGTTYKIESDVLANHLRTLKGNKQEGAIDEGFTFIVRPIVTPNCNASGEESVTVTATVDGSFHIGDSNHINATDVSLALQTLKYKTDNDKLEVKVSQISTLAYTKEAKWLVRVSNRSEFRQFNNFWLGKESGKVDISSIKEVVSLADMTEVVSGITEAGGVYNLGNVAAEKSRYFLITANLTVCEDGSIKFAYGNDCKGVPSSVAQVVCKTTYAEDLNFVLVNPILQTTVIDDPGAEQIQICDPITYVIEVNNAGGEAKELTLNIKMASFLNYVGVDEGATKAEMSGVYTTRPAKIEFNKPAAEVKITEGNALITIPATNLENETLQNAERFYLRFRLQVANCNFQSGQTITLTPAANNFCNTPIAGTDNILEAGTDRIILAGAPVDEPVVDLTGAVKINLTPAVGDPLTADYTAVITNVGNSVSGHPVTGTDSFDAVDPTDPNAPKVFVYKYALKLPNGWIIENPQSFIDANKLKYTGVNDSEKGYIFEFKEDLNFQEKIMLSGKIKFEGNLSTIDCDDSKFAFADIKQDLFTNFKPEGTCGLANDCAGMELLVKTEGTPFNLTKISPTGDRAQAFCSDVAAGSESSLADVKLDNAGIILWYRDKGKDNPILDPSAEKFLFGEGVLEKTYYVRNKLVNGSECLSEPFEVLIYLDKNPIAEAGADQLKYNDRKFTMAANAPLVGSKDNVGGKGTWTFVSGIDKDKVALKRSDITIKNINAPNSEVTIPLGSVVTLKWTVENSCNTDGVSDDVVITSMTAELTIKKTATDVEENNNDGRNSAGDIIKYSFKITNSGQAVIKAPIKIIDDKLTGWGGEGKQVSNEDLIPGATLVVSEVGTYTISLNDMNVGQVVNTAKATGTTPEGIGADGNSTPGIKITSPNGTTTTPLVQDPKLELIKTSSTVFDKNGDGRHSAGDEITYTFLVKNLGNVTVKSLSLTDNHLNLPGGTLAFDKASIEPAWTAKSTCVYTVTQVDLDNGLKENTATVTGTDPKNNSVTDVSDTGTDRKGVEIGEPGLDGDNNPTILDLVQTPSLKLSKDGVLSANGNTVTYTFIVENTGNVTMDNIAVIDPKITPSNISLDKTTLAPKETTTATATYTVTQAEKDAGVVINTATITGTPPNSNTPITAVPSVDPTDPGPNGETIVPIPQVGDLTFVKEAKLTTDKNNNKVADLGDVITYTFRVKNTGNVTLTAVAITDNLPNLSALTYTWPSTTFGKLLPDETATATAIYTVMQADVDAGKVVNKATVTTSVPPGVPAIPPTESGTPTNPGKPGNPGTPVEVPTDQVGDLTFVKDASITLDKNNNSKADKDDVITYTFTVSNTGNVTLTTVAITDGLKDLSALTYTWPNKAAVGTLLPGEVVTATAIYTIKQSDVDVGKVVNLATVTTTVPSGVPAIPPTESGTPTNPGNPGSPGIPVEVPTHQVGDLTFVKEASITTDNNSNTKADKDDIVTYRFIVINTGTVTLSNVSITDGLAGLSGLTYTWPSTTAGFLLPGEKGTATATYRITQKDVDAGKVVNMATVTTTVPPGVPALPPTESGTPTTPGAPGNPGTPVEVPTHQVGDLTFVKEASITTDNNSNTKADKDDVVTYKFTVTNTGTVTLSNVNITDGLAGLSGLTYTWPSATAGLLLPGEKGTATATYTITQKDVDAGKVVNMATVTTTVPPGVPAIPPTESGTPTNPGNPGNPGTPVEVPTDQVGDLTFVKDAAITTDKNNNSKADKDDVITYTFTVTNTGTVTLSDVAITDGLAGLSGLTYTWPSATAGVLLPGEVVTATATYTIKQSDVDAGKVVNMATVTTTVPPGVPAIPPTESGTPTNPGKPNEPGTPVIVPIDQVSDLNLVKSAGVIQDTNNDGRHSAGDKITYTFEVTNTGNITIKDLVISDVKLGLDKVSFVPSELAPTKSTTYEFVYTLTQDDLDAGKVLNTAVAEGKDPQNNPVTDDSDTGTDPKGDKIADPENVDSNNDGDPSNDPTVTDLDQTGAIEVIKTADNRERYRYLGERIAYKIEVRNIGTVTLTDVKVTDNNADDKNVGTIAKLEVGKSETLTAYHTITQADMDRGYVSNIATATGNDPNNKPVTDDSESGNTPEPGDPTDSNCTDCTITPLPVKPIDAINDGVYEINGSTGGTTPGAQGNDTLNGVVINPGDVLYTWLDSAPKGLTLNPDGTITVAPGTPRAEYEIRYRICEVRNPNNCDEAVVKIKVEVAPIVAEDDHYGPFNGKDGGKTPPVTENDTLDGKPVDPKDITVKPGTPTDKNGNPVTGGKITMTPDGVITVTPGTPAGEYKYPYTICEVLNPTNCDDAVVTIVVEPAPIEATDDRYPVNGKDGSTTPSVLENDKLNNKLVDPKDVTLTPGVPTDKDGNPTDVVKMNPDGSITVAPNTPAGTFEYPYTICEVLNPNNCSSAVATIVVEPAPIVAEDDTYKTPWSQDEVTTGSVLENDSYNGKKVDLTQVTLTPGKPSNDGLSMNPDGTITIAPSTRPGTYTYPYTICEVLNPTNCSTAVATIVIEASDLFIPNTFTPNGDGINDTFEIVGIENFDQVGLVIVNRWGNEVYRNDRYDNSWNGAGLNEGTYYYIITTMKGNQKNVLKGWVLIKTR